MTPEEKRKESAELIDYLARADRAAEEMRAATARAKATKEGAGPNASPEEVKAFNDATDDWANAKARYLGAQVCIEGIRKARAERSAAGED